jgi:hypothetical protein
LGKVIIACNLLIEKPERRLPLGRPVWEFNLKMDVKKLDSYFVD